MHHTKLISTVSLLALIVVSVAAWLFFFPKQQEQNEIQTPVIYTPTQPVVFRDDPALGAANPAHTIIEFADFDCAACKSTAPVLREFLNKHPDTALVWKDAYDPVIHPFAFSAALAGKCAAAQSKFWQFHDLIFAEAALISADFSPIIQELNLDTKVFAACAENETTRKKIQASLLLTNALGIKETPYFFVDGQDFGVLNTLEDFEKALETASAK
ncbi:MAG: thioredoxin domain-containing protein [bacterium]